MTKHLTTLLFVSFSFLVYTDSLAQVELNKGLIAYLPLDGNGQNVSGNNHHATAHGTEVYPGINRYQCYSGAMHFAGEYGTAEMSFGTSLLSNHPEWSVSFWFMLSSIADGMRLFGQDNLLEVNVRTNPYRLEIYQLNGDTISINLVGDATNQWRHMLIAGNSAKRNIYIDGVLVNSLTGNYSLGNTITHTRIGGQVNAMLDDLRIYTRVLSADECVVLSSINQPNITITSVSGNTFCAGSDISVSFSASGDIEPNNVYSLQMSSPTGSFATPITIAQYTSGNLSGTFNTQIPTGTPSGTGYKLRVVSSMMTAISNETADIVINGVLGDIPDPSLFRYIGNVNGKDYFISLTQQSWFNASTTCLNNGGHLATIPHAEVNNFLYANLGNNDAHIGLNDAGTESLFVWENDVPLGYTNWNAGEPNNSGNEDYCSIRGGYGGKWNDITGTNVLSYFMELNPAGLNQSICAGSNLQLGAAPLSGANYSWSGPNNFSSTQQIPVISIATVANSGTYTLIYTVGNCSAQAATTVTVKPQPNNIGQSSSLPSSLSTGLVLHYPMNGNAEDASGNGNNGTLVNGVTAAADRLGNPNGALQFNGTNGHITVPAGVYFDGGDFSVSCWGRKIANNSWSRVFDFANGAPNNNVLLALTNGSTGRPSAEIHNNTVSAGQITSPSASLATNQWELITYTWSSNAGRIYINGKLVAQGVQSSPLNVIRNINYIGRSQWNLDGYANALFDDFRIYNRVITESEIWSLIYEQPATLSVSVLPAAGICNGTSAKVVIINSQPGVSYQMRNAATSENVGTPQMGTGDTLFFNTGNLTSTTEFNFLATALSSGCSIVLSPNITVNVGPPPVAPTASHDEVCNGGTMTLGVSGATDSGYYNWYTIPTGGTPISGLTGNTLTIDTNVTVNYYVSIVDDYGCESSRTQVTATVLNPLNPPVDIISNLILHYKFDGDFHDNSGYGYHATPNGNITFVNDRNGQPEAAIKSSSSNVPGNNYLSAGNPAQIQQLTNQVSISFWMRQEDTWFGSSGDGEMPLINKWDGTGLWIGLRMTNQSNMSNRIKWRVNNSTYIESNTNVPVGTWHHVVCTYNGSQLKIYQNGVQTASHNHTGSIGNTGVNLYLGRQANGLGEITYRGEFDEVKIYNRALNLSEIQTLYNNESVAFANTPLCDGEGNLQLSTFDFPDASYQWIGPNGFSSILQNPPVIMNADSATYSGTYSLQVTVNGCTSPVQNVNAVIYQIPTTPVVTNDTICGSGDAILMASGAHSGATYRWYTVPTGGTPIQGQTSATLTIYNVTQTTSRYVSIIRNGCEGERVEVTAFYYNDVNTELTVLGSAVCSGTTATVTINSTETGVYYRAFLGANPVSDVMEGGGNVVLSINTSAMSVGNNTVYIQATRPGCGSVYLVNTAVITIYALPAVSITPSGALSFCAGESVNLTASSGTSYLWNNGETTQTINVSENGTYSVTVMDANNCSNTSASVITVVNEVPNVGISASGPTTFCTGESVTLIASGGTSYLWSNNATTSSITVTQAGTYHVTAYNGNCAAVSENIKVSLISAPDVTAIASQTSVCPGESVTLTGGGAIAYSWNNGVTNGVAFVPSETNTYTVTGTDGNGCSAMASITVNVLSLPDASFTASASGFCPESVSLQLSATNTSYSNYDWFEGVNPIHLNAPSTIAIFNPGTYQLSVTDNNGCTNSSVLTIGTGEEPQVAISVDNSSFCEGTLVTIHATSEDGAFYTWYLNNNAITSPVVNNTSYNASLAGDYHVEITNADGCTGASNVITLSLISAPEIEVTADMTSFCAGDSAHLAADVIDGASYQWLLNNNPITGATSSIYTVTSAGDYIVVVNDGCEAVSNVITIVINSSPAAAGNITGMTALCAGVSSIFTIGAVAGANDYVWTISPSDVASISTGQGTTAVVVNSTNQSYTLTVTPQNACGSGGSASISVNVTTSFPCNGEVMFAANHTNVCTGSQVVFTNYTNPNLFLGLTPKWNFGAGAVPSTAIGNGPHTVTYTTTGMKTVTLSYEDPFGNSFGNEVKTNYINVSGTVNTSAISGNVSVSCAGGNETYSVVNTPGSVYSWTVPSGAVIVSGQGTSSIVVNMNGISGNISVTETNAGGCIGAPVSIGISISDNVNTSAISGNTLVNCTTSNEVYSVVNTSGSSYNWTVPAGAVILSGQGTNSIVVNFNGNFGDITVTETNSMGCVGTPQHILVSCNVSVEELTLSNVLIYPNPAAGHFMIEIEQATSTGEFFLYDSRGRLIMWKRITGNTTWVDVSNLAGDVYIGKIRTENGAMQFRIVVL